MISDDLNSELIRFTALRRQIFEAVPDIDDETLADTLEGATNLHEAISALVRSSLDDEDLVSALRVRLEAYKQRLNRLGNRIKAKRALAQSAMEEAGIERIQEADFTLSLRNGLPSVVITDEAVIPEWFWIPQASKLDRRGLLDALKSGTAVTGAELSNAQRSLTVRIR